MRILSLDLARVTGYALVARGQVPLCGSFSLTNKPMNENAGEVYFELNCRVDKLINTYCPEEIWTEQALQVHGRSLLAEAILLGLAAIAEFTAYNRHIPTYKASVASIRKAVHGKSNATKEDIAWWCFYNGWPYTDPDACDALAVAAYAASCAGYQLERGPDWQARQSQVFARAEKEARA